jgi:hypothetical protein
MVGMCVMLLIASIGVQGLAPKKLGWEGRNTGTIGARDRAAVPEKANAKIMQILGSNAIQMEEWQSGVMNI